MMPFFLILGRLKMTKLVRKDDRPVDISYVEKTGKRTNTYEVRKESPLGGVLHNYAKPVAELAAREKPGYRNKCNRPEVFKSYDYAQPLTILRKERRIKKINAISVILLIMIVSMAILMVVNPTTNTGLLFGVALFGFVVHQLLHKEVAIDPKVVTQ